MAGEESTCSGEAPAAYMVAVLQSGIKLTSPTSSGVIIEANLLGAVLHPLILRFRRN